MQKFSFDAIDSTQNTASELLRKENVTPPFYVTAKYQFSGRGSLGKSWISPEGNFYWSGVYTLSVNERTSVFQNFPFHLFAGAIVRGLLARQTKSENFFLKWPNDILFGEKKIAGVLCETGDYNGKFYIIFGVGINFISPGIQEDPSGLSFTSLAENNLSVLLSAQDMAQTLADEFLHGFHAVKLGNSDYLQEWRRHFLYLNRKVRVFYPDGACEMIVPTGLYPDGSLQVNRDGEEGRIYNASLRPLLTDLGI